MDLYLYILVLLAGVLYYLIGSFRKKRKRLRALSQARGLGTSDFSLEELSTHYLERLGETNKKAIDSLSWNDLEMDGFLLDNQTFYSSLGASHVYESFHYLEEGEALERRKKLSKLGEKDREFALKQLFYLGRELGVNLPFFIRNAGDFFLAQGLLNTLFFLSLLSLLALLVIREWGLILLGLVIIVNTLIYTTSKEKIHRELYNVDYFQGMIKRARLLERGLSGELDFYKNELGENLKAFRGLRISLLGEVSSSSELNFARDVADVMFLSSLRQYSKIGHLVEKNRQEAFRIMELLGELELALFMRRLGEEKELCEASFNDRLTLDFQGLYHPALKEPVGYSREDSKRLLVTGSNASGKSTFMKSMALSILFSQVTGYAFARGFSLSYGELFTSMALRDSIKKKESYFVTEIKSLRRIVERSKKTFCYCFIDEILRGTNTIERIAASSSVLEKLGETSSCIYVASHDIELTELLKSYENVHFREHYKRGDIVFDYQLLEGPSDTTNAILLLKILGFEEEIIEEAGLKVEKFLRTSSWKE